MGTSSPVVPLLRHTCRSPETLLSIAACPPLLLCSVWFDWKGRGVGYTRTCPSQHECIAHQGRAGGTMHVET